MSHWWEYVNYDELYYQAFTNDAWYDYLDIVLVSGRDNLWNI